MPARAATHVGGTLAGDATWTKAGSPYLLDSTVVVPAGATLTVEPGATVEPDDGWCPDVHTGIQTNGQLVASGTAAAPIRFEQAQTTPRSFCGWKGIELSADGPATTFDHVRIANATDAIRSDGRDVHVSNSSFNQDEDGVLIEASAADTLDSWVTDSLFLRGGDGVVLTTFETVYPMYGTFEVARNRFFQDIGIGVSAGGPDATLATSIHDNLLQADTSYGPGMDLMAEGGTWSFKVEHNTIVNGYVQPYLTGSSGARFTTTGNNFEGTLHPTEWNEAPGDGPLFNVSVPGNWWGTTDSSQIDSRIYDGNDVSGYPFVTCEPVLTAPDATAPPPDTSIAHASIVSGPPHYSGSPLATFTFKADAWTALFQCQIDNGTWSRCSSPATFRVANGPHTFSIQALSEDGDVETTQASMSWITETGQPSVAILTGPSSGSLSRSRSAAITFSATQNEPGPDTVTFTCSTDSAAFAPCSSPAAYSNLRDGTHTFEVDAMNVFGLTASASRTWTIDGTPPAAFSLIAPADAAIVSTATPTLSWTPSSDRGSGLARYRINLDGKWLPLSGPGGGSTGTPTCTATECVGTPKDPIANGTHRWAIVAIDKAGNTRKSDSRTLVVQTS